MIPYKTYWVGEWGTYEVPADVVKKAEAASPGKSTRDKRTKGSRILKEWGVKRDMEEAINGRA